MSRMSGVGETPYQLVGTGARWTRRGAEFLGRILAVLLPNANPDSARLMVRARRVSALNPLERVASRLWLAWVFAWRTRWAEFDWYVSVHEGARVLSVAGVVDRLGTVGGVPTRLGMLGGVFTVPEQRRRGLATEVVKRANELIAGELGCEFGVLICVDELIPFYEGLGWKAVPNDLAYERFGRRGVFRNRVMVYECAGRPLPAGTIDVHGLPA